MHQILFVASSDSVQELEIDENPAESYPCMSSQQFHREARGQLYSLVTGAFLDEALDMEILFHSLTDEGPFIYQLAPTTREQLARLDEDGIGEVAEQWLECEELEHLDHDVNDLYDFIYQLAHFCHVATAGEDLDLFIYSDS